MTAMSKISRRTVGLGALGLAAVPLLPGQDATAASAAAGVPVPATGAYFGAYNYVGNNAGVSNPEALEDAVGRGFAINHCFQDDSIVFDDAPDHQWRVGRDLADGRIPMISWGVYPLSR